MNGMFPVLPDQLKVALGWDEAFENANLNKKAFTSKYKCFYLVYYEHFNDIHIAISREKQIKGWLRIKKEKLISDFNPNWSFLNAKILDS